MGQVDEAMRALNREAAWLEDETRAAVEGAVPFTRSRAESVIAACKAVHQAHERYVRALSSADWPVEE